MIVKEPIQIYELSNIIATSIEIPNFETNLFARPQWIEVSIDHEIPDLTQLTTQSYQIVHQSMFYIHNIRFSEAI